MEKQDELKINIVEIDASYHMSEKYGNILANDYIQMEKLIHIFGTGGENLI